MVLFDILIYLFFAFVMYYLAKLHYLHNPESEGWDRYIVMYMLFFTFIVAIRWNVGSDCTTYAHIFHTGMTAFKIEGQEPLWDGFVKVIHNLGIHWTIAFAILGFLQIYFLVLAVRKYPHILMFMPFVLFGGRYWMDINGAVRQMLIACAFVWASKFIYEKKIWWFLLFILIASQIHSSALLLLPLYLIPKSLKIENKRLLLIVILLSCLIIGQTPAYQNSLKYVTDIMDLVGYNRYTSTAAGLLNEKIANESLAFGPMMLTYLLIPIFIIWYGPTLKSRFGDKIKYFDLWYNLSFLYSCLYFLVCNISFLFIRPVLYLSLFQMILASLLLYYLISEMHISRKMQLITCIFVIVIGANTSWDISKHAGTKLDIVTYKVFFMHENDWITWPTYRIS